MARKHNSKKDTQAKARAKAADEAPAKDWIAQRHAEEQAKMHDGAVKDVTYDPVFTPAAADHDAGPARSKSVAADRAGIVAERGAVSREKAEASNPAAATANAAAATAATKGVRKSAKGTRAPRKTARKGNKAGTVKTGV